MPCCGYGFTEIRNKLKNEYDYLKGNGKELYKLKKEGIEIMEEKEYPIFCYLGDSTTKVFENDKIFEYPFIFTECTFLYDDEEELAKKKGHTVWKNLKPIIKNNPNNTFIIYHFSRRYKETEINEFFEQQGIENIIIWSKKIDS